MERIENYKSKLIKTIINAFVANYIFEDVNIEIVERNLQETLNEYLKFSTKVKIIEKLDSFSLDVSFGNEYDEESYIRMSLINSTVPHL